MTPPGTNYPIAEHGLSFWLVYLSIAVVATTAMICLFLIAVARDGRIRRPAAVEEPKQLPAGAEPRVIADPHTV